jgi:hypothetical protein
MTIGKLENRIILVDKVRVSGCGCTYRTVFNDIYQKDVEMCEYLCQKHKDEWILNKYNNEKIWYENK